MKKWSSEEIRAFRKGMGVYQKDLAAILRVSTNYVYMLEKGVKAPSDTMRALLDCLERERTRKGKGGQNKRGKDKGRLQAG